MLHVIRLTPNDEPLYRSRIVSIEGDVTYPLGSDRFTIDHGDDYFAFFRRLGEVHYFVACDGDDVLGVMAAVERTIGWGGSSHSCLYLCDLKRRPGAGATVVLASLARRFEQHIGDRIRDGYGVSMNAADGQNRLVRILTRRDPELRCAARLNLFSLDAEQALRASPVIARHRGEAPRWLSLAGKKDIVLQSSGTAMALLHAQFGPCGSHEATLPDPVDGAVHMLCAPEGGPLCAELVEMGARPSASADVIARGMDGASFDFVLTSDI